MIPKDRNRELRSCDWLTAWLERWFTLENPAFLPFLPHRLLLLMAYGAWLCRSFKPLLLSSETILFFRLSPWGSSSGQPGKLQRWLWGSLFTSSITQEVWILRCNAATCTMVLTFSCLLERLLLLSFWRFKKTFRKQTWRVIDVVAPKTPKPRNWKRAVVIYICSTPRKDICSIILKGFWVTRSVT